MKSVKVSALCAFVLVLVLPATARPCTHLRPQGQGRQGLLRAQLRLLAAGPGHIHVNLRGARKSSVATPGEKPLTWTARYGSISFKAGPRASITNHDGRAYALGTTGHLHCLDAATGKILWAKDMSENGPGDAPRALQGRR